MARLGAGAILALLWTMSAWAQAPIKPVKLSVEIQRKLGLKVQPLMAATRTAKLSGFARVLDPGPLAQLDSDIQAAQIALTTSAAEAARAGALNASDQAISTKVLQGAQAQARTDAARLALLRRRLALEWGAGLARMSDKARGVLIDALVSGRAALVRIDTPSGQGQTGLKDVTLDFGPLGSVRAVVLGAARVADPRLMSSGLIAKVSGKAAATLSTGLNVPITLTASGPLRGVVAPRAALLRGGGGAWVYVRIADDRFLRKPIEGGVADPDGLFVRTGLRPGEAVVTTGSAALLAAETNVGEAGD